MATAFFRTVILYMVLILGLRLTGKRQSGKRFTGSAMVWYDTENAVKEDGYGYF